MRPADRTNTTSKSLVAVAYIDGYCYRFTSVDYVLIMIKITMTTLATVLLLIIDLLSGVSAGNILKTQLAGKHLKIVAAHVTIMSMIV